MNQMFDRYALFISTDFFVDYWHLLASNQFSVDAVSAIQSAGRATVMDLMAGESRYWDVDFSADRHERSFTLFSNALRTLRRGDRLLEEVMRRNFCEDKREQANVAFALGFLHRIIHDRVFCVEAGMQLEDADVAAACFQAGPDDALNFLGLEHEWLASTSKWDVTIRNLTPDLPAYTVTNFDDAYQATIALPGFVANLGTLLAPDAKAGFAKRLSAGLQRQFPQESSLAVALVIATIQ